MTAFLSVGPKASYFSILLRICLVGLMPLALEWRMMLAGIPPTAGFVGKYFLFSAAIDQGYALLAVAAVLNSAISLYYYFKIVMAMYMGEPSERLAFNESAALIFAFIVAVSATLAFGLYPSPLVEAARASASLIP